MTEPLRVLIVEDEAILMMQLEAIFEDEGHVVVGTAMTSSEAIEVARITKPDIAIVDIHLLDGSSGIDVARHLRSSGETLVVFVTANAKKVAEDYEGAIGLISKPYSQAGMTAAIKYLDECLRRPPPKRDLPHEFKLAPAYLTFGPWSKKKNLVRTNFSVSSWSARHMGLGCGRQAHCFRTASLESGVADELESYDASPESVAGPPCFGEQDSEDLKDGRPRFFWNF